MLVRRRGQRGRKVHAYIGTPFAWEEREKEEHQDSGAIDRRKRFLASFSWKQKEGVSARPARREVGRIFNLVASLTSNAPYLSHCTGSSLGGFLTREKILELLYFYKPVL